MADHPGSATMIHAMAASIILAAAAMLTSGCASAPSPARIAEPPQPDPRVGLRAGLHDAEAAQAFSGEPRVGDQKRVWVLAETRRDYR